MFVGANLNVSLAIPEVVHHLSPEIYVLRLVAFVTARLAFFLLFGFSAKLYFFLIVVIDRWAFAQGVSPVSTQTT